MEFGLEVTEVGDCAVVTVSGDLDVQTAPALRDRIIELIDGGSRNLVMDLGPTEFLDSTGLSAMLTGVKRIRALGGDITIVCPPGHVRRTLEIVALDQVFTVYDHLDAAVDGSG